MQMYKATWKVDENDEAVFIDAEEETDENNGKCTYSRWSYLPDLVLEKVFSYLSMRERYYASMVCKSWYRAFHLPYVWSTFVLDDSTLTRKKYNYYYGWQHVLDHMRTQMCITNVGRNFRQLVFGPMMNFFNLYEFMNMLSYFIEWPQGGLEIGTHIRMLRFIFPCNMAARDESERERIFGTGGRLLEALKALMGNLPALRHLELIDLMLETREAQHLLDEVCSLCCLTLQTLILINTTKLQYQLLHAGVFLNLKVLMISPQNLGEDLVQLLAHTNLRHLHIIQNRYTPGDINVRPVPGKIWKQCRHLNSSLAVHLEVKGARNGNVLWQERAPVRSVLYDSSYIKMTSESVLTAIDLYRLDLRVYAHHGLPRFYMPRSFHERVDSLLLLLCRHAKASFWKKNTKAVPGRPSPKRDPRGNRQRNSSSTSFQDFQDSVSDAWDMGDDEFCVISDVKISKKVAQSAALSVINSHRCPATGESTLASQPCNFSVSEEKKMEVLQSLGSHRDPHTASPARCTSTPPVPSSPPSQRQFPGRPQPLRGGTGRSKFHIPSREGADCETSKLERFQPLLETTLLNLEELRHLSWSGIPVKVRAITWRLLSGYLPANLERRQHVLERKRLDYWNLVKQYYDTERDETRQDIYRQIHIDIPRMSPLIALFQQKTVQEMFERILFIWAIRHPASGYVQGINDLVTPFFVVFLQEVIPADGDLDNWEVSSLPKEQRDIIEADSFWCLSKFLDGIQDNYIFAQLGIQHKVNQLKELIQRIDGPLHRHLQHHGVDYLQFSFRWMNNLLTRELPLHCTIRLWDTYLAESDGFASFQLYVCAAFLLHWRRELLIERDFQGLMLMLQNLPTQNWSDSEIGVLVAEAYRLKFTFADAPNHLQSGER